MNGDYLSIKEFAKSAGVSTQYVYKQIRDGKLTQYTEIVDGKKVLKPEALEKIGKQKGRNKQETNEQTIVSLLQEQLKAKDNQIAELQTALQRSQELLKREQEIIAVTQKRILMLEERQIAEAEESSEETDEAITDDSEAVTEVSGGEDRKQNEEKSHRNQTGGGSVKEQIRQNRTGKPVEKRRLTIWERIRTAIRG